MRFLLFLLFPLLACNDVPAFEKKENDTKHEHSLPYAHLIAKVDSIKLSCKTKDLSQVGIIFSKFVGEQITPYWIGTPWDYNGVTQKPNIGFIACGYLVTTILRDAGVSLNRVKMAQCASEQMISTLTSKKENYSKLSFEGFIASVKLRGKGISIVGLDNHTGFLYYDGLELYFIHSSFVGEGRVAKEIASESAILKASRYKVVGFISQDEIFLKRWLR